MVSIICVYNDEEQYAKMISSLKTTDCEFVPVDNCDGKFSSAAQALNYGAEKSCGDVLIFCHQDVIFGQESVKTLAEPILDNLSTPLIVGSAGAGFIEERGGIPS